MITNQLFEAFGATAQYGIWITTEHLETRYISENAKHLLEFDPAASIPAITSVFKSIHSRESTFPLSSTYISPSGITKHIAIVRYYVDCPMEKIYVWELIDLSIKNNDWINQEKIDSTNSTLFEDSPIPIWDEDFSLIKLRIDSIKENGSTDIRSYLNENKGELAKLSELLIVNRINQAVVEINEANSKEQVLDYFRSLTTVDSNEYMLLQMEAIAKGETSCEFDAELITFKGNKRYVHFKWIVVKGCEESYKQVFLTTTDLTERIKDENVLLQQSNREKETLLKEIHHRVKNNLQIISSLVRLQARNEDNKEVKAILEITLGRILSIANVHELLYKSNELASIDFNSYSNTLIQTLINSMIHEQEIDYEITSGKIKLPLEIAIPLGLILNELLTNSLKHGFAGREKGSIKISLSKTESDYELKVSDDGIGISQEKLTTESESLGLLLIESLSEQLNGSLERDSNEKGTAYTLQFPISEYIPT